MSNPAKYSKTTIVLHWLGALLIFGMIAVGMTMEDMQGPEKMQLLDLHRKVGLLTGAVFLIRIVFFFLHARPEADPAWPAWQAKAAKALHALLYLLPLVLVGSGMASMALYGLGDFVDKADFAGYEAAKRVLPMAVHGVVAKLLFAGILLHIVAAFHHQFVQKDGVFKRIILRD